MQEKVDAVVRDVLRPLIEADGGSIEVVSVEEQTVIIRLSAAYSGCPSTAYTLRGVIAPAIRKAVGQDTEVKLTPAVTPNG